MGWVAMSRFFRLVLSLAVASGLLAAVLMVMSSGQLADLGLDFWNLPQWQRDLEESVRRREDLTRQEERLLNRLAAKQAVIENLIAGRLSLKEATAHFRALNEADPTSLEAMRL